jgi:hypothetical protein
MSHFTSHRMDAGETNSIIAVNTPAHVVRNFIRPVCTLCNAQTDKQFVVWESLRIGFYEAASPI